MAANWYQPTYTLTNSDWDFILNNVPDYRYRGMWDPAQTLDSIIKNPVQDWTQDPTFRPDPWNKDALIVAVQFPGDSTFTQAEVVRLRIYKRNVPNLLEKIRTVFGINVVSEVNSQSSVPLAAQCLFGLRGLLSKDEELRASIAQTVRDAVKEGGKNVDKIVKNVMEKLFDVEETK